MGIKNYSAGDKLLAEDLQRIQNAAGLVQINAGEVMDGTTTPVIVYLKGDDGELYKATADSDLESEKFDSLLAAITNSVTGGDPTDFHTKGLLTIPSQTLTETISSTSDQIAATSTAATSGITLNASGHEAAQVFRTGDKVGNIEKVNWYMRRNGANTGVTIACDVYEVDSNHEPTGASLGQATRLGPSLDTAYQITTFTFAPLDLKPDHNYIMVMSASVGTMDVTIRSLDDDNAYVVPDGGRTSKYTTDGGSTWLSANTWVFETFYTEKLHRYGDEVWLSETAGEFDLNRPTGALNKPIKVGRLVNQTLLDLDFSSNQRPLGVSSPNANYGQNPSEAYAAAPARAQRARIIYYQYTGTSAFERRYAEISRGDMAAFTLSSRDISEQATTFTWGDNNYIKLTGASGQIITATIYWYGY